MSETINYEMILIDAALANGGGKVGLEVAELDTSVSDLNLDSLSFVDFLIFIETAISEATGKRIKDLMINADQIYAVRNRSILTLRDLSRQVRDAFEAGKYSLLKQ